MFVDTDKKGLPTARGYNGRKEFVVRHPKHEMIIVRAPNDISAIQVAASEWGVSVLDYSVYSDATANERK